MFSREDLQKAIGIGMSKGTLLAGEHVDEMMAEIKSSLCESEKVKYSMNLTISVEIDTDYRCVVVSSKFKAPKIAITDESDETEFPIEDPNQPGLPFPPERGNRPILGDEEEEEE